jgi:glutathione synthase
VRIGIVVNRLRSLRDTYTTSHLAAAATRAGLQVLLIEIGDFTLDSEDRLLALGHRVPSRASTPAEVVEASTGMPRGLLDVQQLDGLLLRNNPVRRTVLDFARALKDRGVVVLNDPDGLAAGASKLYTQFLPRHLRPRTLVTRDISVLEAFRRDLGGAGVLKPLRGFGGQGVRLVQPQDALPLDGKLARLHGTPDGYLVFQEYLEGADRGDKRILIVEGEPVGCYTRMRGAGEFRHNIHAGGQAVPSELDDADREICDALRATLRRDGIFLAGLDVIDRRAVEVNVVAPGGIANIERTTGRAVADGIIERFVARMGSEESDGAEAGATSRWCPDG